jgi:hypothetical protein
MPENPRSIDFPLIRNMVHSRIAMGRGIERVMNGQPSVAKESGRRRNKIRVRRGAGPPPGYEWNVEILAQVREEARAFSKRINTPISLARCGDSPGHDDPNRSATIDIRESDRPMSGPRWRWRLTGRGWGRSWRSPCRSAEPLDRGISLDLGGGARYNHGWVFSLK